MQSSSAAHLSHTGPASFTTLHAAVVGGCTAALPALVAAGVPLDPAWTLTPTHLDSVKSFLNTIDVLLRRYNATMGPNGTNWYKLKCGGAALTLACR